MATTQHQLNPTVQYTCLQQSHFLPATVNTQPFEQLSHAVLNWLTDHQHDCDIVQVRHLSPHLTPLTDLFSRFSFPHSLRAFLSLGCSKHPLSCRQE